MHRLSRVRRSLFCRHISCLNKNIFHYSITCYHCTLLCTIFTEFIKDLPEEESLSDACPSSSSIQMEPLPAIEGLRLKVHKHEIILKFFWLKSKPFMLLVNNFQTNFWFFSLDFARISMFEHFCDDWAYEKPNFFGELSKNSLLKFSICSY
jgi:hypothetical protein